MDRYEVQTSESTFGCPSMKVSEVLDTFTGLLYVAQSDNKDGICISTVICLDTGEFVSGAVKQDILVSAEREEVYNEG